MERYRAWVMGVDHWARWCDIAGGGIPANSNLTSRKCNIFSDFLTAIKRSRPGWDGFLIWFAYFRAAFACSTRAAKAAAS